MFFFGDFNAKFTSYKTNKVTEIEYNGLIWVILDYYTIVKYKSDDQPKCWLRVETLDKEEK
jgi:hypothetical protein